MLLGRGGLVLELVVVAVQYFQSLAGRVIKLSTTKKKEKKILHRAWDASAPRAPLLVVSGLGVGGSLLKNKHLIEKIEIR